MPSSKIHSAPGLSELDGAPESGPQPSFAQVLIIGALVIGITFGHYGSPLSWSPVHDILRRLYYIPIFLAAYWFGRRGSIGTALGISLLYLPHVLFQWESHNDAHIGHEGHLNKYLECLIFLLFGTLFGTLVERMQLVSGQLRAALEKLQASFEATRTATRLAALGQLSAGFAHEIRNPLAGIRSSLEVMEGAKEDPEVLAEFLSLAHREVLRADKLLEEFLKFARPPKPSLAPIPIAELLNSVIPLMELQAKPLGVALELELSGELGSVVLDASQFEQVLVNLILNATQSAPAQSGRVIVRAERGAEMLLVEVSDNGAGVAEEARESIFDPFFTTRETGVGLGLSVSHQIIRNHGGVLRLREPRPGQVGASFVIEMPV